MHACVLLPSWQIISGSGSLKGSASTSSHDSPYSGACPEENPAPSISHEGSARYALFCLVIQVAMIIHLFILSTVRRQRRRIHPESSDWMLLGRFSSASTRHSWDYEVLNLLVVFLGSLRSLLRKWDSNQRVRWHDKYHLCHSKTAVWSGIFFRIELSLRRSLRLTFQCLYAVEMWN